MKANTPRRERNKKLNPVDWLLILLTLLAAFLLVGGAAWQRHGTAQTETDLICVMRIPGVEYALLERHGQNLIPEGSLLRNAGGTVVLGTVEHVLRTERLMPVLQNGRAKLVPDPDFSDLEVTVRMKTTDSGTGDGLRVGDLRIAAGGRGSFRFGSYYAAETELISVEVAPI